MVECEFESIEFSESECMTEVEAGEKVKQACLDKLQKWSTQLSREGQPPLACVIWDVALQIEKEVIVQDVLQQ